MNMTPEKEHDCPLCKIWDMMPYAKRWSTPTTPQECEGAMAAGYWAASIAAGLWIAAAEQRGNPEDFSGLLCDRHLTIMNIFDKQHAERTRIRDEMMVQVSVEHQQTVAEFLERAKALASPPPPSRPMGPPPVIPSFAAAPPAPSITPAALAQPTAPPPPVTPMQAPAGRQVITFPCPLCGKKIANGQVHDCSAPDAPPGTP